MFFIFDGASFRRRTKLSEVICYEHTIKTLNACKPSYRRSRMSPSSSHPQIIFMMRAKRSVRWHSHHGHSADSFLLHYLDLRKESFS